MEQIKVNWKNVSPADLSSTCCAQYFAFSKDQEIILINNVNKECIFTKVIQASANYNNSIYSMDLWLGYISEGVENFDKNVNSADMMELLRWSAKAQLQKSSGLQSISKREQLRQLVSA